MAVLQEAPLPQSRYSKFSHGFYRGWDLNRLHTARRHSSWSVQVTLTSSYPLVISCVGVVNLSFIDIHTEATEDGLDNSIVQRMQCFLLFTQTNTLHVTSPDSLSYHILCVDTSWLCIAIKHFSHNTRSLQHSAYLMLGLVWKHWCLLWKISQFFTDVIHTKSSVGR